MGERSDSVYPPSDNSNQVNEYRHPCRVPCRKEPGMDGITEKEEEEEMGGKRLDLSPEERKERQRQQCRDWRAAHPERCKAYKKMYYETHKPECLEYSKQYQRKWRKENPERYNAYQAKYRAEHREELNAKRREKYRQQKAARQEVSA